VAGLDPTAVQARVDEQRTAADPYPNPTAIAPQPGSRPTVSVVQGNAPKGESATTITNRSAA